MKIIHISILCLMLMFVSCSKSVNIETETDTHFNIEKGSSAPLHFASINDIKEAMSSYKTKSSDFISYADAVMSSDEYEEKTNAILSEAFGSILNKEGELMFDKYILKVCNFGILYSLTENYEELKELSAKDIKELKIDFCSDCTIPLNNPNMIFKAEGYDNVYIFDTFELFTDNRYIPVTEIEVQTKVIIPYYFEQYPVNGEELFQSGNNWNASYTIPAASEQKVTFPSNDEIANDTKIWRQNYGVAQTGGVKSKTMQKGVLGVWSKITAPVTAAVTNLFIQEDWKYDIPSLPIGWVSINETNYNGQNYVIATKKLASGYNMDVTMNEVTLLSEIDSADDWARDGGVVFNSIDGIRYIGHNNNVMVRLKNVVSSEEAKKTTVDFNLDYGGDFEIGSTASNPNLSADISYHTGSYKIFGVSMFGSSVYDNFETGSQMIYTFQSID